MNLIELEKAIMQWSKDRKILANSTVPIQTLKLVSEIGELADNIAKGNDVRDDIGDCLVLLTNIAGMLGSSLEECGNIAYNDIKDRKGFLNTNGTFIKESDKNYKQLLTQSV